MEGASNFFAAEIAWSAGEVAGCSAMWWVQRDALVGSRMKGGGGACGV